MSKDNWTEADVVMDALAKERAAHAETKLALEKFRDRLSLLLAMSGPDEALIQQVEYVVGVAETLHHALAEES